jgi:hypothetical protein
MKTRKNVVVMISFAFLLLSGLSICGSGTALAAGENKVKPGEFVVEPRRLLTLGSSGT